MTTNGAYPTSDDAHFAAREFLASINMDVATKTGELMACMFAAGWMTGAIRGADAAADIAAAVADDIIAGIR